MQNIKLNYQNLNSHVAIPENDGAGIIGSLSTLYKSIKQTIKQPFISDTSKVVSGPRSNGSATEKPILEASLNAFVDRNVTENKKNLLSHKDIEYINFVANNNEWQHGYSDVNVQTFLKLLPTHIQEKLTAVISTHERTAVRYYGTDNCAFHTFVLGKTETGTLIIDLDNKNYEDSEMLMKDCEFFSKALTPIIKTVLKQISSNNDICTPELLKHNLPEFRLIPSRYYVESNLENDIFSLTAPCYTERNNPSFLNNKYWSNSYRLNIFEFFTLLKDRDQWDYVVKKYDNRPIDRLGFENKPIQTSLINKLKYISRT